MKAHKQINDNYVKVMVKMTREREGEERERLDKSLRRKAYALLNFHQCTKKVEAGA